MKASRLTIIDSSIPPTLSVAEMDDAALSRLVDSVIASTSPFNGAYRPHEASADNDDIELDVQRQWMVASLRHGYFSTEAVAVDISRRIDVEYGNRGPEIKMQQQMTNDGLLTVINSDEISKTARQERYKTLSMFVGAGVGGPMLEEWQALDEDEDIHSVSGISVLHDEDPANYKHCSFDCWLKSLEGATYEALPELGKSASDIVTLTTMEQAYNYERLGQYQTRLVTIQPGRYGDTIVCTLSVITITQPKSGQSREVSSDVKPIYEALSYTWGDASPAFKIQIDGKDLPVAHNLFFAMQHLRHENDPRSLWIDAICINQRDPRERSEQVVHMLQIYKNASRVVVSLGEESKESHIAMKSMLYMDNKTQREEISMRSHDTVCYEKLKELYEAQCRLFESPWFRRSWIRQEIMAAKDVTVLCGRDAIGWYAMKRSAARLRRLYNKMTKENVLDLIEFHDDKSTAIACLRKGWIYGQPITNLLGCIHSVWYYHSGGFLDLLMASREYDATDAKDKVYSVLGLARVPMTTIAQTPSPESTTLPFTVDYSKSVSEVYQDVVKYFINRDRNLDILSILLTHRNAASDAELPSWVPDWRVPVLEIPIITHWDFISTKLAAGGFKVEALPQSFEEKGILRAQGYIFDALRETEDYSARVHNVLCTLAEFDDDEDGEVNRARQRGEQAMYADKFDPQKHRTRTGSTVSGKICLVPAIARSGDCIAILLGSKLAFVLRLTDPNVDLETPGTTVEATIVGPCIVPEVMFGMLVKTAKEHEVPPTQFRLV